MPSSASSSPGLSRPTTPTNHHHTSRPVSPVSKTNVANKRLRKDEETELPPAKKAKNGITHVVSSDNHIPKNNSKVSQRKKKLEEEREHLLEQKLLTARRQASKVRTTQELVQELALNSTPTPNNKSKIIVNETKTELMNRFFQSQDPNTQENNSVLSPPLSDTVPDSPTSPDSKNEHNSHESVEDILAQLPPIDSASILAEMNSCNDEEDDIGNCQKNLGKSKSSISISISNLSDGLIPVKKEELSKQVQEAMVEELHSGQHESVNGNFNHDGTFREWHEVVTKETLHGDLLYILPYSVID